MTSPRIAPGTRQDIGALNHAITWVLGRVTGTGPPAVFTTIARNRGLFRRWLVFASGLMPGGRLPRKDTELIILRVADRCGSDYEWAHHSALGIAAGLSAEEVERIRDGAEAPGWSSRHQAFLRATDQLHDTRTLDEDAWTNLREHLDEPETIEFCLLVGHYEMVAMTLNSLRVQPDAAAHPLVDGRSRFKIPRL